MEFDWTQITAVLTWIVAGGGSVYLVNYALAWFAENFEFWHKLPSWVKFLVPIITSVLLAVGAQYLLGFEDILGLVQPYWEMFIMVLIAWLGSQKGYITAKKDDYGAEKRLK